jgi:hypothetical protein
MSRSYKITRDLTFNAGDGYWTLDVTVDTASNLNPRVFLVEKYVVAGNAINTVLAPATPVNYVRTLLRNEPISVPLETDETVQTLNGWVSFRTNTISRKFYTYEDALKAQSGILAVLKSNTEDFKSLKPKKEPRLVAINMSSKDKAPVGSSLKVYKGDVISLQLVNGPRCETVISDNGVSTIGTLDVRRVTSNSISVKLLGDDHTYIGLKDLDTQVEYSVNVTMLDTNEDAVTENI